MASRRYRKGRSTRQRRQHRRVHRRTRKQRGGDPGTVTKHVQQFFKAEEEHQVPGCFFSANEENIEKGNKVLIIGPQYPKQTADDYAYAKYPYEECIFIFDMDFPPEYPLVPPHMTNVTSGLGADNFRYHPNLYELGGGPAYAGKVCLSVLGTWGQLSWVPPTKKGAGYNINTGMNIVSVLQTVQSILGPNPLHNEPGHEARVQTDPQIVTYNHAACYRSIANTVQIYQDIFTEGKALSPNIEPFVDQLKERAFTALQFLMRKLATLKKTHPKPFTNPQTFHHRPLTIDYDGLLGRIMTDVLPLIPADLAKVISSEDSAVKTAEEARQQELKAQREARMLAMGLSTNAPGVPVPGGAGAAAGEPGGGAAGEPGGGAAAGVAPAPKPVNTSLINAQIKNLKDALAAVMASGNNNSGLRNSLKNLQRQKNKLLSGTAAKNANSNNEEENNGEEYEYNYNE